MKSKKLTSVAVLMMSLIIMLGIFALPASAATSLSKATVTYEVYQTYTGKAIKPTVTVKVGSKKLTKDKSYTVTYSDNKNVGKGYITIKGKGSYKGTVKKGFYIQPKATSSLKATPYSTKVKLSWSKVTGAKGYQVYLYQNKSWKKLPTTSKTSCTVTGLDSATTYKFKVRPYAKVGDKTIFGEYKTVSKTTTVGKVTAVDFSNITATSAELSWKEIPGATEYRITYIDSTSGYTRTVISGSELITLRNLSKGTVYKVKFNALNTNKKITGNTSDTFTFTTAPAPVTVTGYQFISENTIKLSWTASSGASGYKIYFAKVNSQGKVSSYTELAAVTATNITLKDLTPGSTYIYKVVAFVNSSAGTIYSSDALSEKIFVPLPKISDFAVSEDEGAVTKNSVTFCWSRPTNIDGYKLYCNNSLITILEPGTTEYTFTNLAENTSYKFSIKTYLKTYEGELVSKTVTTSSGAVASVEITNKRSSLKPGETYTLKTTVLPADATDKSLTYTSSNTSVATISSSGVIKAIADGTTTITVKSNANSAKYDSFTLTVKSGPVIAESISLPSQITMYEGDLISLNPTIKPADTTNKSYTITSSDYTYSYNGGFLGISTKTDTCLFDTYISVSNNNLLKAKKATITPHTDEEFSFTVTVKTADGSNKTATTKIRVLPKMIIVTDNGSDSSPWFYGNSSKLTATLDKSIESKYSLSDLRFSTSDSSIATVTNDGTVTCTGTGDVTITVCTYDDEYSGSYTFYVRSTVSVSKTFYSSCRAGQTYQINASVLPADSDDTIMYYSSDTSVATVTNTGLVTYLGGGEAMIAISCTSDPYNYKQVWFTSDSFTSPSGSTSQILSNMKLKANAIKTLSNLPSITRFDETVTSNFATNSKELTPQDLQDTFSSELSPKTTYLAPVSASSSDYTVLKGKFMDSVPVKGQDYIISIDLAESDIKEATVVDNGDYYYEMKLTLKEESMASLPYNAATTRHGKVFDILTSDYINTYLSKINSSGQMSVKYSSFAQRYYNSTLTLKVNKATDHIEKAVFDMTVDVDISKLELKYGIISSTMDVSFTCNNIVSIEFGTY